MKLENNQNLVLYKDKIQNDYKKKFSSKIQDIESLIKNYNLEEKNKTLEIQKRNANYNLEKLDKELINIENYLYEEDLNQEADNIKEEQKLQNKINDIRQKNLNILEQIKMMRDYYTNLLLKYKTKQITEKKQLNKECKVIRENIVEKKYYTKMTEEEKIILEKENEIKLLKKELDKISKKVEEAKTTKAINDIRIKELQKNINKPSSFNKTKNNKKFSKNIKSKIRNNFNSSDKKNKDFGDVLTNIKLVQNLNYDINQKSQEKSNEVEPTINLINRKLPFSISALDNIINENSEEYEKKKKNDKYNENSKVKSVNKNKKKNSNINKLLKKNINIQINSFSENKIINKSNENQNSQNNNNNNIFQKKKIDKYSHFNINKPKIIEQKNKENNINIQNKNENLNNNKRDNDPLGWLENDTKNEQKNDNVNNNGLFNIFNDNNEDKKVNNSEDLNKKDNIYNNKNLEVSGIKGAFNRRKPFSSIKF